jgi:protein-tyrosine phosphatase
MARIAVADGIEHMACTPHITPGVYGNTGPDIQARVDLLSAELDREGISLGLWIGADVHVDPALISKLESGLVPTLAGSRYLLLEPPHHVAPPRLADLVKDLVKAGYVPIITHPERLRWIETHYDLFVSLIVHGALVQVTAASITGGFGNRPRYWSERMLDEGIVDIVATDAHNTTGRPPILSAARDALARRLGDAEALELVYNRPARILRNEVMPPRPQRIPPQVGARDTKGAGFARSLFKKLRGKS